MVWLLILAAILACSRGDSQVTKIVSSSPQPSLVFTSTPQPSPTPTATPTEEPPTPTLDPIPVRISPTPDDIRATPEFRKNTETHVVRYGDTLNYLAHRYGVAMGQIQVANGLQDPNLLAIGQILVIPPPTPEAPGPSYKVIPDSELVYGPSAIDLDSILRVISP
jgi:LasA protease